MVPNVLSDVLLLVLLTISSNHRTPEDMLQHRDTRLSQLISKQCASDSCNDHNRREVLFIHPRTEDKGHLERFSSC